VLVEQTAAIAPERMGRLIGHVSHRELADIDEALRLVFELT
jgi:mRNA interferase MazF